MKFTENSSGLTRLPTLAEVLSRKTKPPVDLFCLYLFLQREGSEDALDFWLDTQQHENLCRAYFKDIRKSGRLIQDVWPEYLSSARSKGSIYSNLIGLAEPSNNFDRNRLSPSPINNQSRSSTSLQSGHREQPVALDNFLLDASNNSNKQNLSTSDFDPEKSVNTLVSKRKDSKRNPTTIPRNAVISHGDLFDSAERIYFRYLAPGSDKEIYLPPALRIQNFGHNTPLTDIPDLFYPQKEYIFRALEGGVFPRFLRAKGFGNLTPMSSLVRLGLGLFLLWFAFALGFCFIFIDYKPQKTRVWVLLPFLISFFLLWSFKYNIDPLMVLFNKRTIEIEEPYVKKLLLIRTARTRCTIYCSVHTHIRVGAGSPPLIVYLIVRFGSNGVLNLSSISAMACETTLFQPNQELEMEIAEYINTKKSNCPREAAFEILRHVNQGSPRSALLALHLLDVLVKNCGYPFHLQIATKDFLNELVRRFPERPPAYPGPIMGKTLELINEWKNGVATTSKHKEDLVHVRDMWRLLGYKGYRFPELSRNAAITVATDNLKSPEELEEEDREAQSAKLQELIRRGTPRDLAAAQDLMKKLSGFPDYRAQTLKELDKVQHKAILLNDMLDQAAQTQEKLVRGDAYDQVASLCKQASPKLQKWISDASESDPDLLERLLQINDLINNVVNRYTAFKNGDYDAKFEMNENFQSKGITSGNSNDRSEGQNLIDFDDPLQYEHVERDEGNDAGVQLGGGASSELPVDLFSAPSPGPTGSADVQSQTQPAQVSSPPAMNLSSNEALKSLYAMRPTTGTPVSYSQPYTPAAQSPITPGLNTPANINNTTTSNAQFTNPQPHPPQQPQQKSPFDDLVDLMK
ncbi:hypothetical protein E3P98_03167 [Wallemia ichthyophaga]|nr:hypothetical protein E3P98_03167 [Wallemia ichthyophaga]